MATNTNGNSNQQVAMIEAPRLPFHEVIHKRFGLTQGDWKALVEAVYPTAKSTNSVIMALSYCRARKLDPFKRPVHIVPMWSRTAGKDGKGGYVETIWPGISELRTTAFRTGQNAGVDSAVFGPDKKETFEGTLSFGNKDVPKQVEVTYPEWCQITVHRVLNGQKYTFVGPKAYWLESYARQQNTTLPNDMWSRRPYGQLEKVAEAAALRRAYPEEIGNDYAAEEMDGQRVIDGNPPPSTGAKSSDWPDPDAEQRTKQSNDPPKAEQKTKQSNDPENTGDYQQQQMDMGGGDGSEVIDGKVIQEGVIDEADWLNQLAGAASGCEDHTALATEQTRIMMPMKRKVSEEAWKWAEGIMKLNFNRILSASG